MDMEDQAGEQAPGMPESRSGAFSTGLAQSGERFQSMVPTGFAQHSVLQQSLPSANGMSADDYQRILPGVTHGGRRTGPARTPGTRPPTCGFKVVM
jgi:hypothetical protein